MEKIDDAKKKHIEEIENALLQYNQGAINPLSTNQKVSMTSRSYREYKEEEESQKTLRSFFEKMCSFSGKLLKIEADKKTADSIKEAAEFTDLRVTPNGVAAFAVISFLFFIFCGMMTLVLPLFIAPGLVKVTVFLLAPITAVSILKYPQNYATSVRIKSSGELVMVVLYMVVYMKTTPNLEAALRFAATSAQGKIGRDLKLMLWKLENGQIQTIDDGLMDYVFQWKKHNREFMDAIEYIRASMRDTNPMRRENLLDKAMHGILEGTDEKMKHYSRELKMPILVIHGLGILLPIMGMVIFPLAAIFLGDSFPNMATYLIFGYNIVLPLGVYVLMTNILNKRPSTKAVVDISNHPDATALDKMTIGKSIVPVWPFALAIGSLITFSGIFMLIACMNVDASTIMFPFSILASKMVHSVIIIIGIAMGFAIYFKGTSFQKIKIIQEIQRIEEQFETALFALGNRLSGGSPIELSLAKAVEDTKDLEISGFMRVIVKNMSQLNMTFKQALFNKKYGALRHYPSKLIKTVMQSISESVDKGTKATSLTMLIISEYLRGIRTTQEKIDDILSETTSSMKFQAFVLVPMISGVVVSTAQIIMQMMVNIQLKMDELSAVSTGTGNPLEMMISVDAATPPWVLQLIVGIYVIEILILLAMFVTKISEGDSKVKQNDLAWQVLVIGIIMYLVVLTIVSVIFGGLIAQAMSIF